MTSHGVVITLNGSTDASGTLSLVVPNGTGAPANNDGIANALILTEVAAVPEPSSTALLGLGGLALILRRRK